MNLKFLEAEWQILLFSPWLILSMNPAACQGRPSANGRLYCRLYNDVLQRQIK